MPLTTLYVLHHSHTDIGYTERQDRITRWHVDFVRQALRAIEQTAPRRDEHFSGFRWVCETFWGVERFLERASEAEREAFAGAVRDGDIGLSASYLNFNELVGDDVLRAVTRRAAAYGASIGVPVRSAMTADINGSGWGFSQALVDHEVENLFTCVHTHHGMYPLGRTQVPFWWETPRGDRLLTWSGEHYHFGNALGVVPGAVSGYLIEDELDAEAIFGDSLRVAEIRIPRYVERLAASGYPYEFVPVMASGLRNDNAPPNAGIAEFVSRWNREHGDQIRVEMTTLDAFFDRLRRDGAEFPVHRGDWPDWWSDGPASSPAHVRLFREAQRGLDVLTGLREHHPDLPQSVIRPIHDDLVLYAEHTFSHSDSMSSPWYPGVLEISAKKKAFAASAHAAVAEAIDDACVALGAASLSTDTPLRYRVLNPLGFPVSGVARLGVGHYEFHERDLDRGVEVWDAGSGDTLPCDLTQVPRGADVLVHLALEPGEERTLELFPAEEPPEPAGAESLETRFVRIEWRVGEGIVRFEDREGGRDLLRGDRPHAPFSPVYEVTPVEDPSRICAVRGEMGLNRKGADARRSVGRLVRAGPAVSGRVTATAELSYECEGFGRYEVELRAHQDEPRVDFVVRMHKTSVWEPENVYVPLPFAGPESWLFKAGATVRPRVDQIPGTLTDFYSVQEGFSAAGEDLGIAVATPDTHLLQLGSLDHGPRRLMGEEPDEGHVHAWVMTNYWETNFEADLGGFYEFRYRVRWGEDLADPGAAREACRAMSHGLLCFRLAR
ncbi:MAG: glycoside hydrolase family 38 N-terminal domain-containing protein [Planctomycetota bacterium]|jgi:hypothetical protein